MSHDRIDPREEQMADFPFKDACEFPSSQAGQTICPHQIFWSAQTSADKQTFAPVVAALHELGIVDKTYVVFSTDNGAQSNKWQNAAKLGAFDNAVGTQGPFRGCKASLYDGGHRVPFIVSGPGVPKGRVDHSLLSSVDWMPTVASLAGAKIPAGTVLRGADQSDIWHGKASDVTTRAAGPLMWRGGGGPAPCWNLSPSLATRNGDWKLLLNPDYDAPPTQKQRYPRVELYNMSVRQMGTDAMNGAFFEGQNHAAAHADVVAAMAAPLLAWHRQVGPKHPGETDQQQSKSGRGCEAWPFPGMATAESIDG